MLANGEGAGHVYEFLQAFNGLTSDSAGTPWSFVENWEDFVAECEEGFWQDECEYKNDSHCRETLEKTLYAPEMEPFPEQVRAMKERVFAADERLRALFMPGVQIGYSNWNWWERGVLRYAADDYADYVKRSWGIELASPPNP